MVDCAVFIQKYPFSNLFFAGFTKLHVQSTLRDCDRLYGIERIIGIPNHANPDQTFECNFEPFHNCKLTKKPILLLCDSPIISDRINKINRIDLPY